jgi:hypothetical protein
MRWIDWEHFHDLTLPLGNIAQAIYTHCCEFGLSYLMQLSCDWNEEVVAQFYATLYVDDNASTMHFSLGVKKLSITLSEFAILFRLRGAKDNNTFSNIVCLHDDVELAVSKMSFMYDRAYGAIIYGHPSGLTPYYKLFYLLFWNTLCPRGGNSDKISKYARNLLFQMAPSQPQFNACHFLWSEIIECSHKDSTCHYAPYIFHLVKHVTKLKLQADIKHKPYNTPEGKLNESFHLGKHRTGLEPRGKLPGDYPVVGLSAIGPSSSQAHPQASSQSCSYGPLLVEGSSHSHGVPKDKKGKLDYLARGMFACFNMGRQNARE